ARLESDELGLSGNLLAAQFNMQKVSRHVLIQSGATYQTRDEDFLAADDRDFHPTDVLEDADGSIVVIDTGGWYKLCCPTSQLHRPDLLGGIYRVSRRGAPRVDDPRGLKLDWPGLSLDDLVKLLGDRRPAVRRRAVHDLADRGPASVPALRTAITTGPSALARCQAVWAATRIKDPEARAAV